MTTLRWIVIGILGGAIYSWLVTIAFAQTFAVAWPEWYQAFFEGRSGLGFLLWDIAIVSPAIVFALLVGLIFVKAVHKAALPAAIVGALVTFLCAVLSSLGGGWMQVSTFIVVGLLPLSTLALVLYDKSLNTDTVEGGDC